MIRVRLHINFGRLWIYELNLIDWFERVVVLNLARRADRWSSFVADLPSDWPFQSPERLCAIDGRAVGCPGDWRGGDGAWGCYRTHLSILEQALSDGTESILILEDDAICCDDFTSNAAEFCKHLPDDWSFLYLGGQHIDVRLALPIRVNPFVYRPFNVNRTHAIALRGQATLRRVYYHLLDHAQWNCAHHIDHRLGELHKNLVPGLYVPAKWLVAQRGGESDVNGREQDPTDFLHAEALAARSIDLPAVFVLSSPSSEAAHTVSALQELGVNIGQLHQHARGSLASESLDLRALCSEVFSQPNYVRHDSSTACVEKLKTWAAIRCFQSRRARGWIGGFHPALCLIGRELVEACPRARFIVVDAPEDASREQTRAENRALAYEKSLLEHAADQFIRDLRPPQLRLSSCEIKADRPALKQRITEFLEID